MATADIPNTPPDELSRSPAAARVGQLAAASGLLLSHFERRAPLPLPEAWWPIDRPDLGAPEAIGEAVWAQGRLVEPKYHHFRYDTPIGSFHPGHRAKWTAHELCHGLVGFAWRPDASPFFHSLVARLGEILPVALWYFLDEAGLRRCAAHQGGGPLFNAFCPACERTASSGPRDDDPDAARWLSRGRQFVDRELAAVARAARTARSVAHRYATLDLESDALAYVAAHRPRLESPEFERFVTRFHGPHTGCLTHLDALSDRVESLTLALCGEADAAPLTASRDQLIAQDLAWRLLQVGAECAGEVVDALDTLVDRLAEAPGDQTFAQVRAEYAALTEAYFLPPAEVVFGVGYALPVPGDGLWTLGVAAGLPQSCPETCGLLDVTMEEAAARFIREEPPTRGPLARRFAAHLARIAPGPVAEVAAFEAAIAHPGPPDAEIDALDDPELEDAGPLRRADGLQVLACSFDVRGLIDALNATEDAAERPVSEAPTWIAVRQTAGGEVVVADLSADAAAALEALEGGPLAHEALAAIAPTETLSALRALGLIGPATWSLSRAPAAHPR